MVDKGKNFEDIIVVTPDGNADSADSHAYKLRKEWGLSKKVFMDASNVVIEDSGGKILLFFNDTHGSGDQFIREFSHLIKYVGDSNCFILCYALARKALSVFRKEFPNITIVPELSTPTIHEKNIFTLQQLEKIQLLGDKVCPPHPLGYGDCGLLVAYHFQCPNNNLPIVWADGDNNSFINSEGQKTGGYPWIPLFPYKPKQKFQSDITKFSENDCLSLIRGIEQEFLQCRKDAIGRTRRKAITQLLSRLNWLSLGDFSYLDLKVRMLTQASREARSLKEFHNINLEIERIYELIFQMQITESEMYIAVNNFVNWAIDFSQLAGNSVELNKIISRLNTATRKIGLLIRINAKSNNVKESEMFALRAKGKRAMATLLQKRSGSGQKAKLEINNIKKQALEDAQNAYNLNDCALTKHELALCLFANTATMDSDKAIHGLELLHLAYKEGSPVAAYELTKQLRMRHRNEEAIYVFKSVAERDDDRRRFHSNVSFFAYAVIGVYYNTNDEEKYKQDALLACRWLDEVISYEHHTAKEIVAYCKLKLICGFPKSEAFAPLEILRPMSTMAWDQLADIARKLEFGDDSMAGALLLGLEDASVWSQIGTLYSDFTSQFDKALEFYDRAIRIDKRCPIYHFNKARTFAYKLHDYHAAHTELIVSKSLKQFSYAWYKQNRKDFNELKSEIQKKI
ncbi:MAG: hypothetical protein SCARUB_00939 [Candidatus Scalindua rubra]|uniref:PRTase-CE domain-containing protein n=1 Tax=Candidatus Scalindua rubra TaxID=1872076 RepID=A0A1E3XEA8_9BACT|nr:MAG: hypothetical protein SCARUB_00939 [Candidatus Scalindua rubra]